MESVLEQLGRPDTFFGGGVDVAGVGVGVPEGGGAVISVSDGGR